MFREHKIVICIPAGRRKFMEILMDLLSRENYSSVVDECHFWVNTTNFDDLQWIKAYSRTRGAGWVHLKNLPVGVSIDCKNLWWTVCHFYKLARASKTIYIKIDDDTVLIDPLQNFKRFLDFRIDHPEYFLVSANVINNSICTHFMQSAGILNELQTISYNSHDKVGMSGKFAEQLHNIIIDHMFDMAKFHFEGFRDINNWMRLCINCIAWFGEDMRGLEVPRDDEIFLSTTVPRDLGRKLCVFGGYSVCHFSYGTQHHHLLANTSLLEKYQRNCLDGAKNITHRQERFQPHEINRRG